MADLVLISPEEDEDLDLVVKISPEEEDLDLVVPIPKSVGVNRIAVEEKPDKIAWPYNLPIPGGGKTLSEDEIESFVSILTSKPVPVPRPVWDPDDCTTWKYFKDRSDEYKFLPDTIPTPPWENKTFKMGEQIYYYPVFELYSIRITRLRNEPKFDKILFLADSTDYVPLVIYKRRHGCGDSISVNQPLPLKGPGRITDGEYRVVISLSNPFSGGWVLYYYPQPDEYDVPLSRMFEDGVSHSEAEASFEIVREAAKASLLFQFIPRQGQGEEEEEECSVRILGGTISATNDGNPDTQRIVKQFSSSSLQEMPPVVVTKALPVDRHVFGVPKGSSLQVTAADLVCEEQGSCFQISGTLTFPVPTHTCSHVLSFTTKDDTKSLLRLTVFWSHGV